MSWEYELTAYCKNCGQQCVPERYRRQAEEHERYIGAFVTDHRSPCCHDELSADPVSAVCIMCGKSQDPQEDLIWPHCEDCKDVYCPGCAHQHFQVAGVLVLCGYCASKRGYSYENAQRG